MIILSSTGWCWCVVPQAVAWAVAVTGNVASVLRLARPNTRLSNARASWALHEVRRKGLSTARALRGCGPCVHDPRVSKRGWVVAGCMTAGMRPWTDEAAVHCEACAGMRTAMPVRWRAVKPWSVPFAIAACKNPARNCAIVLMPLARGPAHSSAGRDLGRDTVAVPPAGKVSTCTGPANERSPYFRCMRSRGEPLTHIKNQISAVAA